MSEKDTPSGKNKGGRPKKVPLPKPDAETEQKGWGGARDNAGAKRHYKRLDVAERLEFYGFDIIQEYMKLYFDAVTNVDRKLQYNILSELLKYSAPTMRPVDAPGETSGADAVTTLLAGLQAISGKQAPPPRGAIVKDDDEG